MVDIIIKNGTIVTMNEKNEIIKEGIIAIDGNEIVDIGNASDLGKKYNADTKIDASGKVILPGLINAHDHSYQILLRGMLFDKPLPVWDAKFAWPAAAKLTEQDCHLSALLTYAEMIKSGTTCAIDNWYIQSWKNADYVAKAFEEIGIRGIIAWGFMDRKVPESLRTESAKALAAFQKFLEKWNGAANGRMHVWFGLPGTFACSMENLKKAYKIANKHGLGFNIHVAGTSEAESGILWEHGMREVEFLLKNGLLGPNVLAVHCVWVTTREINILKETGTKVVHNPIGNMNLASGVAPITEMLNAGMTVALGTDGLATYSKDMFEVMRATAWLHKVTKLNSETIDANKILRMATIEGAKALNLDNEIGSLEPNKKADIVILNLNHLHTIPRHFTIPQIVYCAKAHDVETVLIDGRMVVKDRQIKTINESDLMQKVQQSATKLWERTGFAIN